MASYTRRTCAVSEDVHEPLRLHHSKPSRRAASSQETRLKETGVLEQISYTQSPPSLLVLKKTPFRPRSNPNIKIKRTWPPSPVVEDEKTSLARELNPTPSEDDICSEAQSRGTLDQLPIILDVDDHWEDIEAQLQASDSSFTDITTVHPVPIQISSSKIRKQNRHRLGILPINSNITASPVLGHRQPSPYVFTPRTPKSARTISTDAEFFEPLNEVSSWRRASQELKEQKKDEARDSLSSKALRGNGRIRDRGGISLQSTTGSLDGTLEDYDSSSSQNEGRSSGRQLSIGLDCYGKEVHDVTSDHARMDEFQPKLSRLRAEALEKARRTSEPIFGRPQFDIPSSYATPSRQTFETTPETRPGTLPLTRMTTTTRFTESSTSPRQMSSNQSQTIISPLSSPLNSPRITPSKYYDGSPSSGPSPAPDSRTTSRTASPTIAIPLPKHDEESRHSSTSRSVEEDSSHVSSRLISPSLKTNNCIATPRIHASTAAAVFKSANSLPYPVADMPTMPSENDHMFHPQSLGTPCSRSTAPSNMPGSLLRCQSTYGQHIPTRPKVGSRHTFSGQYPGMVLTSTLPSPKTAVIPSDPKTSTRILDVPCPRSQPVWGYDDWYTLDGCSSLNVCPTCFNSAFWKSSFHHYFKRAAPKDINRATTCDLSSPWMRLAWLLTIQQWRKNLDLLSLVADIDAVEASCPGTKVETRYWYTFLDNSGQTIDDFDICLCDVEKLKALLPSLRGFFRRSGNTGEKRICDFRANSTRCRDYLDLLIKIDDEAYQKNAAPDLSRFTKFVHQKSEIPECQRDLPLRNDYWHSPSSLPEFTVCEDCYHSVIHPAKKGGSSVARRFESIPIRLSHEASQSRRRSSTRSEFGTSCQLYSPRMRAIFATAVEEADFKYLADKARERKEMEAELRQRKLDLLFTEDKVIDTLAKSGVRANWQTQPGYGWLKRDFERLSEDWRAWE